MYELPVSATRCPVCGSKRITRLYDSINISSGLAKATDRMVEPAYLEATRNQDSVQRAVKQNGPALAVPLAGVGAALARMGVPGMHINAEAGKGIVVSRPPSGDFVPIRGRPPRPSVIARDTEFAVTRKADGSVVGTKA